MRSLYLDQPTWLHRVRASAKLGVLAGCGVVLAFIQSPPLLAGACLLAAGLLLSLGRPALRRAGMLRGLLIACGLIVGFHWMMGSAAVGWSSALRLATAGMLALALTLSTRFEDLLAVLERLLEPLRMFGLPVERIALALGLLLRFMEDFYLQWQRLNDAYRARTGHPGGLRLLSPLIIRVLMTADRVADALAARLGR